MTSIPEAWIEAVARAIYDAENGLDGDRIATMIQENFRVEVRDGDRGLGDTRIVCASAARAAITTLLPLVVKDMEKPTEAMVEQGARHACFHGQYEDDGEAEFLECQRCGGDPANCEDWHIHALSFKREAKAAHLAMLTTWAKARGIEEGE